jgi:hypothetical protein
MEDGMLELAFTVCMLASPDRCEERSLLFVDISPLQCAIGAQAVLASWSLEHSQWHIVDSRCQPLVRGTAVS